MYIYIYTPFFFYPLPVCNYRVIEFFYALFLYSVKLAKKECRSLFFKIFLIFSDNDGTFFFLFRSKGKGGGGGGAGGEGGGG